MKMICGTVSASRRSRASLAANWRCALARCIDSQHRATTSRTSSMSVEAHCRGAR